MKRLWFWSSNYILNRNELNPNDSYYSDFRATVRLLRACVRNSLGESGFRESNRREPAQLAAVTTATVEIERNERVERGRRARMKKAERVSAERDESMKASGFAGGWRRRVGGGGGFEWMRILQSARFDFALTARVDIEWSTIVRAPFEPLFSPSRLASCPLSRV